MGTAEYFSLMKYSQGAYNVLNPSKYAGKGKPKYRSSWELAFMSFCDKHPSIISWASESIQISYFNPLKQQQTIYVPDFFVIYEDKHGQRRAELVEIKPSHETSTELAGKNPRNQAMAILNQCKWAAAQQWCAAKGITFRVLTEHDLFVNTKPNKKSTKKS